MPSSVRISPRTAARRPSRRSRHPTCRASRASGPSDRLGRSGRSRRLAEMRPDEIDAALPDVNDLYDRVSDQNATTL